MDRKTIYSFIIGIAVGGLINTIIMNGTGMDHTAMEQAHHHSMIEVAPKRPIPSVTLTAVADSKDGFNINAATSNFTFAPEHVGTTPQPNEGHLHVYVNGAKVMRIYGSWAHLPGSLFKEGENIISVTLNANDHADWALHGEHIEAETKIIYKKQ